MKQFLTLNIALLIFTFSFSKDKQIKLPKITLSDLEVTYCPIDSSAPAQILNDIGDIEFIENNGINYTFRKTTRIQILKKNGYKYATIKIPYSYGSNQEEQIIAFSATSYTEENGEIITETANKKALFDEDVNGWWKRKKYAFSKVKEGTIIEYTYEILSPNTFHLPEWFFQHEIPVINSQFKINICPFFHYIVLKSGFLEFDLDTVYTNTFDFRFRSNTHHTRVYEWGLNNVPAFDEEDYITSEDDYRMKVQFQLESYNGFDGVKHEVMTTWKDLIDELDENHDFGIYIESEKKKTKTILENLSLERKTDYQKMDTIFDYVKNNYYWNNYNGGWASQTKRNFLESKAGNAGDINLFLHSLLKEAGLNSSPLLLSTRRNGKIFYEYPFLNPFNYVSVVVEIGSEIFLLDATTPLLPLGLLPHQCINEYGLQIKKVNKESDVQFFTLKPSRKNSLKENIRFTISSEDNNIVGEAQLKTDGYNALNFRRQIQKEGLESIKSVNNNSLQPNIKNLSVENLENTNEELIISYDFNTTLNNLGDKLLIDPFSGNEYSENKFKQKERIYPVDFGYITDNQFYRNYQIPKNFKVEYLPEKLILDNPELQLHFEYIVQQNYSFIQCMAKIEINKLKYSPEEYKELKKFFDDIAKKMNESIVISKME